MPSVSEKQHRFFQAVAHSDKFAKKVGVDQEVAKEFLKVDREKHYYDYGGGKPPEAKKKK